jgi:hypothetical protein
MWHYFSTLGVFFDSSNHGVHTAFGILRVFDPLKNGG